ncbi:multicopper oxidase domain-containing protein [Candidatus Endoriftia persephonae]|nr:multicopper oxidase domain-containing protein [Candidatus Endoriftia persephone]USF86951.1 multicopper oxidase domain-containing protein [Candidatus Endoriftia persephone]
MKKRMLALSLAMTMPLFSGQASAQVRHLYLAATDGYHHLPDHNVYGITPATLATAPYRKVYMRGFCDDVDGTQAVPGCANMPAPIIDVTQGDDVFVHLRNIGNANPYAPADPHTIHLHGMELTTQNDGFNETAFEVPDTPGQNTAVYYFKAQKPGTYMWHCHVEASEHITLGMYGAMVIRPRRATFNSVYGGNYLDRFDKEYLMVLTDVDTRSRDFIQLAAAPAGSPAEAELLRRFDKNSNGTLEPEEQYNFTDFKANWWMVNGRAFPDTLLPVTPAATTAACNNGTGRSLVVSDTGDFEGCNPPASGPLSGFLTGSNNATSYAALVDANYNDNVLMRLINIGYTEVPWHAHGWHFTRVGKDANPIDPTNQKQEYTVHIGSGETHDMITRFKDLRTTGGYASNSMISNQGSGLNEIAGAWGVYGIDPAAHDNNLDVQWYPMHSHNDYFVTNNGAYPGGMAVLVRATTAPPPAASTTRQRGSAPRRR